MDDKVLFYGGNFGYGFCNFSAFRVSWRSSVWMTSEHAYQAAKFDDWAIVGVIANAPSAYEAYKLARQYDDRKRATWADEKLGVMEDILRHKMAQHELIRKHLRESGDRIIMEDSPIDSFWGRGPDWQGENHLGKIWMKLRAELLEQDALLGNPA